MTDYDTITLHVQKGVLEPGKWSHAEFRHVSSDECYLNEQIEKPTKGGPISTPRVVLICAFGREQAERWAEENLPTLKCREPRWAALRGNTVGEREWYMCARLNHWQAFNLPLREQVGSTPFPGTLEQARFEWCEVDNGWRWVWQPEGGVE